MIRLKCIKCEYTRNCISENDTFKECPICKGKMKVDNLDDIVADECLEKMIKQIREIGKAEMWQLIEAGFPKPIERLKFRQLYYVALKELEKKRNDLENI